MGRLSVYGVLAGLEAWIKGYRSEHYKLGIQQGICFALALLPVLVDSLYKSLDRGGSVLYTAIVVAAVLEPSTGDSFRKFVLRILSAGVSGGLGMLILLCAVGNHVYSFTDYREEVGGWVVCSMVVFGFIFMTNRQRYWRQREYWEVALLTLPIVIVPAVRSPSDIFYKGAAFRMANVMFGIIIAAVISFCVFPVRARGLLERKMASTLKQIGDLAVWMVGQACTPPQPGRRQAIQGASGTDSKNLYLDDGLRAKLAPLMHTARDITANLAYMGKLLDAASAEVYIITKPRRFPLEQYRDLLDSCHVVLGIILGLLYSLESGEISLQCCQRHIGDLSETGVRLSAAFTALSSLIRPPKAKKKKDKRQKKKKKGHGSATGSQPAAAATANGVGAAGGAAAAGQQQSHVASPLPGHAAAGGAGNDSISAPQAWPAGEAAGVADGDDDPFAELEQGEGEPGHVGAAPVVQLSKGELMSAQLLARRMSRLMSEHSARGGGSGSLPVLAEAHSDDGDCEAHGGSDGSSSPPATAVTAPHGSLKQDMGATSLTAAVRNAAQRREWVLGKLRALVDSISQLEGAALREREQYHYLDGLPGFLLIVHSCVNMTRQCGACFTALDPERGAQLHAYYQESRSRGAITDLPKP